jgi:predicted peptidase
VVAVAVAAVTDVALAVAKVVAVAVAEAVAVAAVGLNAKNFDAKNHNKKLPIESTRKKPTKKPACAGFLLSIKLNLLALWNQSQKGLFFKKCLQISQCQIRHRASRLMGVTAVVRREHHILKFKKLRVDFGFIPKNI